MLKLTELFNKRFHALLKEMGKYGRLIFNDHFSIVLFVLLGFIVLLYKNLLQKLSNQTPFGFEWLIPLFLTLLLTFILNIGQPLWLNAGADRSYLFPRGRDWLKYWQKAFYYDVAFQGGVTFLLTIVAYPLVLVISAWQESQWLYFIFSISLFKGLIIFNQYVNLFHQKHSLFNRSFTKKIGYLLGIMLGIMFYLPNPFHLWWMFALLIAYGIYTIQRYWRLSRELIDFEYVIEQSQINQSNFYKWVSLFADVPQLRPAIKERKWLNPLIHLIVGRQPNRYSYYFARQISRHEAFSSIWIRMTLFVVIMLLLLSNHWVVLVAMGGIGYWLTLIQLLAVYNLGSAIPFQHLYPLQDEQMKQVAFQRMILWLFFVMTIIFSLVLIIKLGLSINFLLVMGSWLIIMVLFVYLYIPYWLKKIEKNNKRY